MKKFVAILPFLLLAVCAAAQENWNILLHKKILLTAKEVNEEKNRKVIRAADWKKTGYLEVRFRETTPSNWLHSVRFADEQDQELLVKDSTVNAKISTTVLRKSFAGKKEIRIYMVIAPADPMIMAPARRIHLATLKLP